MENKTKKESKSEPFSVGFTDAQKKQIVNSALTTASQILMSAIVLTNSENFIKGDCIYPDGSKWTLRFEKYRRKIKT